MKTKILKIDDNWDLVLDACNTTVNKEHKGKIPSSKFKTDILISEHSVIRLLHIHWFWENIYSWVSGHWVRHKNEKFVSTRRSDRTGIDRKDLSQEEPVNFQGEANPQQLIDIFRKRLCYQASPETRELAEDFKMTIREKEPELSDVLCPNCVYRNGCPEIKPCGYFDKFKKHKMFDMTDIRARYDAYNEYFYSKQIKDVLDKNS